MMLNEYKDIESFDKTILKCLIKEGGHKNWIVVSHGLGEHIHRHEYWLKHFGSYFNIAIYDLRFHGRTLVANQDDYSLTNFTKDLDSVLLYLKTQYDMKDFVLFGHCLGGLITSDWLKQNQRSEFYPQKVILSAPLYGMFNKVWDISQYVPKEIFKIASWLPSFPTDNFYNIKKLSHDTRSVEDFLNDQLTLKNIPTKLIFNIQLSSKEVFRTPLRMKAPLSVILGSKDTWTNTYYLKSFFKTMEKNAQLNIIEGAYHELFNEVEKFQSQFMIILRNFLFL